MTHKYTIAEDYNENKILVHDLQIHLEIQNIAQFINLIIRRENKDPIPIFNCGVIFTRTCAPQLSEQMFFHWATKIATTKDINYYNKKYKPYECIFLLKHLY